MLVSNGKTEATIKMLRQERGARAMPAPPILLAHDVGILPAMLLAERLRAPAVVGLAPL